MRKRRRKPATTTVAYDFGGHLYTLTAPVKVVAAARRAYKRATGKDADE